jgi:dTDP-4-dehydrorhamnose 3,5-epimerase-like enzyme
MKFTKFRNLKNCKDVRIISSNKFYNDKNGRMSIIFEERQIYEEIKNDFQVNSIVRISSPFNAFNGMECQFGKIPQKLVIANNFGLARFFVVNADPNSENFGETDSVILNKGSQIFIPEYHFWGFLTISKKCDLTVISSGIFDPEKYMSISIFDFQNEYEKFEKWDFSSCKFGKECENSCKFNQKLFQRMNEDD